MGETARAVQGALAARRAYWGRRIMEWARSGQTQKPFSVERGSVLSTLQWWRGQAGLTPTIAAHSVQKTSRSLAKFIPGGGLGMTRVWRDDCFAPRNSSACLILASWIDLYNLMNK